tara:strand:+ start:64 stop:537 length:474 start_codon:yes stop_codon:yes gene_type:complete
MKKYKNVVAAISILILANCTQQGAIEDVTTGLYEEGGMSYLDKNMQVPSKVYFEYNEYNLDSLDESDLELQANWLEENPSKYILIEGHCDERGTREYNLALGERRANATRDYLVSMGISPDRVSVITFGKERPDVEGSYETAWEKNRRSVTTIDVDR